jgi:hypothetical protein
MGAPSSGRSFATDLAGGGGRRWPEQFSEHGGDAGIARARGRVSRGRGERGRCDRPSPSVARVRVNPLGHPDKWAQGHFRLFIIPIKTETLKMHRK